VALHRRWRRSAASVIECANRRTVAIPSGVLISAHQPHVYRCAMSQVSSIAPARRCFVPRRLTSAPLLNVWLLFLPGVLSTLALGSSPHVYVCVMRLWRNIPARWSSRRAGCVLIAESCGCYSCLGVCF
jgi:hypothetical protein